MYIRTKDGVYEVLSEYEPPEYTTLISNPVKAFDVKVTTRTSNGSSIRIVYGSEVISQSESIEELCDEFVVIRDSTKINQLVRTDDINYLKEMMKEDKRIIAIKGAIWTDFGLKYVARLTEDGGVELICT